MLSVRRSLKFAPRPSRAFRPVSGNVGARPSAAFLFGVAVTIGAALGPIELAIRLAAKRMRDPSPLLFRLDRSIVWTIPLFHLITFSAIGLALACAARWKPGVAGRWSCFLIAFVASFSLALTFQSVHVYACAVFAFGFAFRCSRRWRPIFEQTSSPAVKRAAFIAPVAAGISLLAIALAALLVAPGARSRTAIAARDRSRSPNILWIVLDTVRADHLSLYGYHRATSPNLERLAARGVLFQEARATAPWTLPSHAGMMTGRYVHELSAGIDSPLDSKFPTIAEHLAARGYATAGFVANDLYCGRETGLDRGFEHYEDHVGGIRAIARSAAVGERLLSGHLNTIARLFGMPPSDARKTAAELNRDFLAWLDRSAARPFFAFLNYYDAHSPYETPEPPARHFGLVPSSRQDQRLIRDWFLKDKRGVTARDEQLLIDAYDDCVARLDAHLGKLFEELRRRGLMESTAIVVTADHGESFGEHGLYLHASSLYRPETRVPLLIVPPLSNAGERRSVSTPASLHDLAATTVSLAGVSDGSPFPGTPLIGAAAQGRESRADPVLIEVDAPVHSPPNHGASPVFRGRMEAIVHGSMEYIKNGDGREELYDLSEDPGELRDLSGLPSSRAILAQMRAFLARLTGMVRVE